MSSQETVPQGFNDLDPETKAMVAADLRKFNVHAVNSENDNTGQIKAQAANLLEMARMLETDAHSKREQAYRIDPSLRPAKRNQPAATVAPVEIAADPLPVVPTLKKPSKAKRAA
jgi:hypothetical protein